MRLFRAIDALNVRIGKLASWLCLIMVIVGGWNAVARYFGRGLGVNLSSNALIEAQWYMFSVVFLLGAAYTLQRDEHVRVDVLYGRLGARGKAVIDLVGAALLMVPFLAWALWASLPMVRESFRIKETSPDPGGLLRWPLKLAIPLAFFLLLLQSVSFIGRRIADLRTGDADGG